MINIARNLRIHGVYKSHWHPETSSWTFITLYDGVYDKTNTVWIPMERLVDYWIYKIYRPGAKQVW